MIFIDLHALTIIRKFQQCSKLLIIAISGVYTNYLVMNSPLSLLKIFKNNIHRSLCHNVNHYLYIKTISNPNLWCSPLFSE